MSTINELKILRWGWVKFKSTSPRFAAAFHTTDGQVAGIMVIGYKDVQGDRVPTHIAVIGPDGENLVEILSGKNLANVRVDPALVDFSYVEKSKELAGLARIDEANLDPESMRPKGT